MIVFTFIIFISFYLVISHCLCHEEHAVCTSCCMIYCRALLRNKTVCILPFLLQLRLIALTGMASAPLFPFAILLC